MVSLRFSPSPSFASLTLFLLLMLVSFSPTLSEAAQAARNSAEYVQPDGSRFPARLKGDEWFSWRETEDGYVIEQDAAGCWTYCRPSARGADFELVPGAEVGKIDPATLGLRKRALPAKSLIQARLSDLRGETQPMALPIPGFKAASENLPTVQTPAPSAAVARSTHLRCVVILAAFSDNWDTGGNTALSSRGKTRAEYEALLNTLGYDVDGAVGSVRDYYREVSYGKTDIDFRVSDWVKLPQTLEYYGNNANEVSGEQRVKQMAADAVTAADAAGFDFSQGDSDGDGWVDLLLVIHSGYSEALNGNPSNTIWPRQWALPDLQTRDGKKMWYFATTSALRGSPSTGARLMRIGTTAHELGHLFGLSDLYDVGGESEGIGVWGLMAAGNWGTDFSTETQHKPTHMCAFSKALIGYLDPARPNPATSIELARLTSEPSAHLIAPTAEADEYFLIENRGGTGFDSDLPAGLLITHVDTKAITAVNSTTLFEHPAVRVEQSDGGDSLSDTGKPQSNHVWTRTQGISGGFRDDTGSRYTNATFYEPGSQYFRSESNPGKTGIEITDFSAPGPIMSYRLKTRASTLNQLEMPATGYRIGWQPVAGAQAYEIQEGRPLTATAFVDDAESLAFMREHWQTIGAVTQNSERNDTPGGAHCYEFAGRFDGPEGSGGLYMPEYRAIELRTRFVLTTETELRAYVLSKAANGYSSFKAEITRDDGASWSPASLPSGYVHEWAKATVTFSSLQAAGFQAGDLCRIRISANFSQLNGWSTFPQYGYAIDDIELSGIERPSVEWKTLANSLSDPYHPVAGAENGEPLRYRVRAQVNGIWQDWSTAHVESVTESSLEHWRATHLGSSESIGTAADDFDADHDGLSNLLEYALGSLPNDAADASYPTFSLNAEPDSRAQLSFTPWRTDVAFSIESTSDLAAEGAWTEIPLDSLLPEQGFVFTEAVPVDATAPRYLRFKVEAP